jgi:NAD(P)-dependent dehydrogenase (short-subunit alcohol dehydrogenase family)
LITTGRLEAGSLGGQVAVVTGAGRGIGVEAARALIWLGARVIIAEIDQRTGRAAAARLGDEFGEASVAFVHTDVGSERSVRQLKRRVLRSYGRVDVVLNNATVTPIGPVQDIPIEQWDASYRVNLRGPVLLARAFLPGMLERDQGVFVCVSSVGEAYMGAYETLKAAQVHLAHTLSAELEGTGVSAFAIGPGLVRTPGAQAGIERLAPLYGKTVEAFYAMSEEHVVPVEGAGAGFAAAVALAPRFHGQEIGVLQALNAAGIYLAEDRNLLPASSRSDGNLMLSDEDVRRALVLCQRVRATLAEQAAGWAERPLFERQWMKRDFNRHAGMTVEQWLEGLDGLKQALEARDGGALSRASVPLDRLSGFYEHLQELATGYVRDTRKLEEQLQTIEGWREDVDRLTTALPRASA